MKPTSVISSLCLVLAPQQADAAADAARHVGRGEVDPGARRPRMSREVKLRRQFVVQALRERLDQVRFALDRTKDHDGRRLIREELETYMTAKAVGPAPAAWDPAKWRMDDVLRQCGAAPDGVQWGDVVLGLAAFFIERQDQGIARANAARTRAEGS